MNFGESVFLAGILQKTGKEDKNVKRTKLNRNENYYRRF
jgi:hypothetical protein